MNNEDNENNTNNIMYNIIHSIVIFYSVVSCGDDIIIYIYIYYCTNCTYFSEESVILQAKTVIK